MDGQWMDSRLIATHLGDDYGKFLGAVVPPIFMNSLHVFPDTEAYLHFNGADPDQYTYGRVANPTVRIVEEKIAALEHGQMALCFASGMAAATTAILSVCKSGSHVICVRSCYGPIRHFLDEYCVPSLGMSVTYVEGKEVSEFAAAILPQTDLIILESPSSLVFSLQDLAAVAALAKEHGIRTYADNSYCTPLYQRPLELGIDLVMHTTSKYLGGHSDVIGGVLIGADRTFMQEKIAPMREFLGGIPGPMEAWLVMRGIRSLEVRLPVHEQNALAVAHFLEKDPHVKKVYYPGLPSHPQYALAQRQQKGSCGLLSFELNASPDETRRVVDALKIFKIGVSWGGFESLVCMPCYKDTDQMAQWLGGTREIVRIHCGLEGAENLIADLKQALSVLDK